MNTTLGDTRALAGGSPRVIGRSRGAAWLVMLEGDRTPTIGAVPAIHSSDLDGVEHDPATIERHVEQLLAALRSAYADLARTTSGLSWLDIHRVPVLRLLRQAVGKVLSLSSWAPFARTPTVATQVDQTAAIAHRATSASEYRYFTVTWPGVAYLLGAPARARARLPSPHDYDPERRSEQEVVQPSIPAGVDPRGAEFVAVSWSSRHVETLRPVLDELAHRGRASLVLDLGTSATDRFEPSPSGLVSVDQLADLLEATGGLPEPPEVPNDQTVRVGAADLRVDRLLRMVASVLDRSFGCTQPSWAATERVDGLVSNVLEQERPRALLCSNDTSPLGHLSVRIARAFGISTVYLQHGAWVPEKVAWAALHCHRIVVMGQRDRELAITWATDPETTIHVLGQPRFDALADVSRERHRDELRSALAGEPSSPPDRIVLFAAQPFSPEQLLRHVGVVVEGLRRATERWALVVAPHPAQEPEAILPILHDAAGDACVALTRDGIGSRDCLAGADALITVSSTCGIEALLVDVPVLELAPAGERTLGLADHGTAIRCTTPAEVAHALDGAARKGPPAHEAKDAICRWDGRAARRVADLLTELPRLGPDATWADLGGTPS